MDDTKKLQDEHVRHYAWLIRGRFEIQKVHNELYRFLLESKAKNFFPHDECLNATPWRLFSLLLGASFALWRAVPLIDHVAPGETTIVDALDDAKKFLENLLEDNAINYAQDKRAAHWTVRYYLNSARLRLLEASRLEIIPNQTLAFTLRKTPNLVNLIKSLEFPGRSNTIHKDLDAWLKLTHAMKKELYLLVKYRMKAK